MTKIYYVLKRDRKLILIFRCAKLAVLLVRCLFETSSVFVMQRREFKDITAHQNLSRLTLLCFSAVD